MNKFFTAKRIIVAGVLLLLVIIIVAVSVSSGSHKTAAVTPAVTPTSTAPVAPAPPVTQAPAPAPSTPSTPAMTEQQQQAVQSAQGYLTDGEGFSREGLLKQLESSYGEGFAASDATFAVNYLNPDWDAQAVESAQGYVNDGEGFSKSGLTQQLTSSYGEGFTQAQATYAVNKVMG